MPAENAMSRFAVLLLFALLASTCFAAAPSHDRQFWRAIAKDRYAVPQNESADGLAPELSAMLASPDPELRDDLAYSILARWIYRGHFSVSTMITLTDEWRMNLKSGIGETGTDSVMKRSFSALCLAELAKRESKSPFMGEKRFHDLTAEGLAYLNAERDLRGYDAKLHWIHATAHTADLLAALANSPLLSTNEADSILQAIDQRLATASEVYTQGEQDRLAAAVVSVIRRKDFDASKFEPWLAHLQEEDRDVWNATTVEGLARFQNHNYMLQALTVRLSLPDTPAVLEKHKEEVVKLLSSRLD
jgi:hypothetical protein